MSDENNVKETSENPAEAEAVQAEGGEAAGKTPINVTVKTQKQREVFEVSEDLSVKEFKQLISSKFDADVDRLNLIFAGKIMKNEETLAKHNIKDGLTVHLVIRAQSNAQSPASNPYPGILGVGLNPDNLVEIQNHLQREIQSNPQLLQTFLNNPLTQHLMSDPESMRTLIMNNPQMQQLIERNPEISHMLNNPDLMRQTMELARNPATFQEMMRSHDRALANLESIPGGYNALQRMYRDVQEPMLDNLSEQLAQNPFASLGNRNSTSSSPNQTPTGGPIPNPWTGQSTPSTQNFLQQMSQNPELIRSLFSAPYTQTLLSTLASSPNVTNELIAENPLLASNPGLQDQVRAMMPQFLEQLQNPDMQNMLSNPDALSAVLQIQEGLEILRQSAPNLLTQPDAPGGGQQAPTTTPPTSAAAPSPPTVQPPTTQTPLAGLQSGSLTEMMSRIFAAQSTLTPEDRYRSQLEQLAGMGFTNRERNLQALIESLGNIEVAIEKLLTNQNP